MVLYSCQDFYRALPQNPYYPYGTMYHPSSMMPGSQPMMPGTQQPTGGMQGAPGGVPQLPPGFEVVPKTSVEESYIENILRANRGKIGTFYMTIEGSEEWNSRVFRGRVETAGRDHIIISDPMTGKRYLLLMINLSWVEFDEPIVYPLDIPTGPSGTTSGITGAPTR